MNISPLRAVVLLTALLALLAAGVDRPDPPGPHVGPVAPEILARTAFRGDQPLVGTYYFYWYDVASGAHFIDGDGSDALTRHPARPEGYSFESADWHERELRDVIAAGIDFVLPVYWGWPGDYDAWSFAGLPPLVAAARRIEKGGERAPRIGCFYDTSTLKHNGRGYHADLTTTAGKEWFYTTVRDFYALIPPDLRATIDGRPMVWLYSAGFAKAHDPAALDDLRTEFANDFGSEPYIVKEVSWRGRADATYAWGAALKPTIHGVAAVGPGYDHSAVPGRSPLVREREDGEFYRRSWEWVLARPRATRPLIAVVETWNEWHEGTDIAPSIESGRQYVGLTREYSDLWHRGEVLRPRGRFAECLEVSVVLGAENLTAGIVQNDGPDGVTRAVEANGRSARTTVPTRHGGRYIYFDVDDAFFFADGVPVVIEITFLDAGTAAFGLDYDSTDPAALLEGAFKPAPCTLRRGTDTWRTERIRLEDAAFTGRANSNDFRLVDHDGTLTIHRVSVRKDG